MPVFAQLQRASFFGIEFPIDECEVQGGIRDHLHEYPHASGAAPEKLGRRLYTIRMMGNFGSNFPGYPGLWPAGLAQLRNFFEAQQTGPLVIPTVGTIQAYARTWSQTMTNKLASGEKASFEFVEDQDETNLISALISVNVVSIQRKLEDYGQHLDAAKALDDFAGDKNSESLFDSIANAANALLAVGDQIELASALVSAKIDFLANLFDQFDHLGFTHDPANFILVDAAHDLWAATIDAQKNLKSSTVTPMTYIVPSTMAMSAISTALYGDTSHAVELMQLNVVPDLFAVSAGTRITFIPPS